MPPFGIWLKLGFLSFGGPAGQISMMHQVIVVAFVGFVGAWTKEVFGPDMLLLAGVAGTSVVTLFTFTPSFLFILLGGPAVEATRQDTKLTAPLISTTAAVVGVILNPAGVSRAGIRGLPEVRPLFLDRLLGLPYFQVTPEQDLNSRRKVLPR